MPLLPVVVFFSPVFSMLLQNLHDLTIFCDLGIVESCVTMSVHDVWIGLLREEEQDSIRMLVAGCEEERSVTILKESSVRGDDDTRRR